MTDPVQPEATVPDRRAAAIVLHAETATAAVERFAVGAVRIRRVIVTERRMIEVDVAHEELVIEHLEAPPAEATGRHRAPVTEPLVIELHAEQIRIDRPTVLTERVTVHVDQVTEQRDVSVDLRHEVVDTDGSATSSRAAFAPPASEI